MSLSILLQGLMELAPALKIHNCPLIIAGGFGLYLRQTDLEAKPGIETTISREQWCAARSTADIDIFLETEIVTSLEHMQAIRSALDKLEYTVMANAKNMHFQKSFGPNQIIEINFLTGPITDASLLKNMQFERPRIRPKGKVQLHAYLANEAIGLSEGLVPVLTTGAANANVFIPNSATYLLMKLHAFRDRLHEPPTASQHAIDIYRIVAMMTEPNFEVAKLFLSSNKNSQPVKESAAIVQQYFSFFDKLGFTNIRAHPLFRTDFPLNTLKDILQELFKSLK